MMPLLMPSHNTAGLSCPGPQWASGDGWQVSMQTPVGAAPYFLENQHPRVSMFSIAFSSTGCQNGKKGRSADRRVSGRGWHPIARPTDHKRGWEHKLVEGQKEMNGQRGHMEVHPGTGHCVRGCPVPGSTRGLICVTLRGAPRMEPAPSGFHGNAD